MCQQKYHVTPPRLCQQKYHLTTPRLWQQNVRVHTVYIPSQCTCSWWYCFAGDSHGGSSNARREYHHTGASEVISKLYTSQNEKHRICVYFLKPIFITQIILQQTMLKMAIASTNVQSHLHKLIPIHHRHHIPCTVPWACVRSAAPPGARGRVGLDASTRPISRETDPRLHGTARTTAITAPISLITHLILLITNHNR